MVMRNSLGKAIVRTSNQGSVNFDVFDQRERALLHKLEERFDNSAVLRVSSQLPPTVAISIRNRCCCRPDTTRADFGTGRGPLSSLVSLSSSLPAGWPCTRSTSRVSSSRLFETATFFRQDTSFGFGTRPQISDKDSLSTVAWRLEEEPELGSFGHTS